MLDTVVDTDGVVESVTPTVEVSMVVIVDDAASVVIVVGCWVVVIVDGLIVVGSTDLFKTKSFYSVFLAQS